MGEALATMAGVDRQAVAWDSWQGFTIVLSDREFSPHKPTTLFLPEVLAL